ncbi:hypothetical protein IMZ48_34035, partial [Candidatus Bathyarchaeota archaeon]|nr:hypothetical protein [Candidatus Bathyarchaeota archaeon]
NRMKTMLANEEPDSDLELLFAEDDEDVGFEDVEGDASDVHMDSSSDDEDDKNAANELEGEEALDKEARERRTAMRKRKAQEAIPAKFRKKVRIQPSGPATAPAPAPRARKKSERLSWLPSNTDAPTRASSRQTTRQGKEQLHVQMKEREVRRLQQVALMEKRAAQTEALKKPPMTQEQRLAEAALVEKRNSKSLNRWEVAEKQREEERRARLAALSNRTLKGPVITFWSGKGDWGDGRGGQGGAYHISIEEKPKKKRLTAAEKEAEKQKEKGKGKGKEEEGTSSPAPTSTSNPGSAAVDTQSGPAPRDATPATAETNAQKPAATTEAMDASPPTSTPSGPSSNTTTGLHAPSLRQDPPAKPEDRAPLLTPRSMEPKLVPIEGAKPKPTMALPAIETSAVPQLSVLAAPVLAPPAGLSPTVLAGGAYATPSSPKSNVLAPPNTTQRPSPLSLPPSTPAGAQATPSKPPTGVQTLAPKPTQTPNPSDSTSSQPQSAVDTPRPAEDQSSEEDKASQTRSAMILQNFNESAIKDKVIQTQILFGRKMTKLQSTFPPSPTLRVSRVHETNHPIRTSWADAI